MAELPEDPSNRELLERIIALEGENSRLRAQIDDLLEGFKYHIDAYVGQISRIDDLLWPVVDKVFPKFREMQDKMDAIVPPFAGADPRVDRRPREYDKNKPPREQDDTPG